MQAQHPGEPEFYGPASWEEVDTEELERIAVNIMRSVVPSTENLEVGARLAMQAAAMEADNNDPLGLGRIDTRQLALVRSLAAPMCMRAELPCMRAGAVIHGECKTGVAGWSSS